MHLIDAPNFRLKDRENRKRDDLMKQHESGKEEMRKVAEEIEHERQMKIAKVSYLPQTLRSSNIGPPFSEGV